MEYKNITETNMDLLNHKTLTKTIRIIQHGVKLSLQELQTL